MKLPGQKSSSAANHHSKENGSSFFAKKNETSGPEHTSSQSPVQTKPSLAPFFTNGNTVQAQLEIHPSDDVYEKEADAMADRVMQHEHAAPPASPETPNDSNNKGNSQVKTMPLSNNISRLQRKRAFESPTPLELNTANLAPSDEMPLQRKAQDGVSTGEPDAIDSTLQSSRGRGTFLPNDTREKMESGFGTDFSNVKVHTDKDAAQMNDQIGAKAFAHGNDIYFNQGEYKPGTSSGDHLLAHELTHTVQQGAAPAGNVQRKTDDTGGGEKNPHESKKKLGKVERAGNTYALKVAKISVPDFKLDGTKSGKLEIPAKERDNKQVEKWEKDALAESKTELTTFIEEKISKTTPIGDKKDTYVLKYEKGMVIGTKEDLVKKAVRPFWDSKGKAHSFHVDHIHEFQIGGADDYSNFWLLDAAVNIASGKAVKKEKDDRIKALIDEAHKESNFWAKGKPDVNEVKGSGRFTVTFESVDGKLAITPAKKDQDTYTKKDIKEGVSVKVLKPATDKDLKDLGVTGQKDEVTLFLRQQGGKPYKLKTDGSTVIRVGSLSLTATKDSIKVGDDNVIKSGSTIKVHVFKDGDKINKILKTTKGAPKEFPVNVYSLQGLPNVGYLNSQEWSKDFKERFEVARLSPIEILQLDIDDKDGIVMRAKILPTVPIISKANIEFVVRGNEFYLEKVFTAEEIKVPSPFKINGLSLAIRAGTIGIEFEGYVNFAIEKVGEGSIRALVNSKGTVAFEGEFNFDSKTFNPAKVKLSYVDGKWSIEGHLGVAAGAIKGVKEAHLTVKYEGNTISFSGDGKLDVPGVDSVVFAGSYTEGVGYKITATATLKKMTGIKSGSVTVTVFNKNNGPVILGLAGTAVPDFPPVPGLGDITLTVFYEDGVFDVRTRVNYKKGRFDGTVELGVTNKAVDEKGQPQGEPQKGDLVIFGFGSLTVDLFKGSKGTINVRVTPDKQFLVAGSFTVKDLKPFGEGVDIHKKIVEFPTIKIPLVGVPGVSIFFEIGGGAYFNFKWDPLVLKELTIAFTETNINEIETAQVTIHGEVGSKAIAEAYMEIKASLGAQVLIAEIKGSLAGDAGIGVEAEAGGAIDATWNNEKGLQLKEINAYVAVNPKAIFRLKGSVSVDLDLWVTTINLYYKEWILAEGSADLSGLSLKVNFPLKFDEQGNLIRPGFEQLNIEKPDFSGEQGKAALDGGINGEAKKERKLAKDKLRQQIADDMRSSRKDEDFSPTDYAKQMQKKYKDDEEMKAFIMDSVEEEVKIQEYEEFEQLKNELRKSELPLNQKIGKAMVFKMFRARISPGDYDAFITELRVAEQQKQEAAKVASQAPTAPATT
ncbi:MAG: DUF4157 domain-containing protein [Bacteroidota bacterium]|nr:DUF4157 domain-containing protein [Bacteroidota bacterium]